MASALEISVKFGISLSKVQAAFDYAGIDLEEESFSTDSTFEVMAKAVTRKRASSFALAYLAEIATVEQREFILNLDRDFAARYAACDFPVQDNEKLQDAKVVIDMLVESLPGHLDGKWTEFAEWIQKTIKRVGYEIDHSYIAVRILLSLDTKIMRDYPSAVASLINKARHRGYLKGWFTIQPGADKNTVIYHTPGKEISAPLDDDNLFEKVTADALTQAEIIVASRSFPGDFLKQAEHINIVRRINSDPQIKIEKIIELLQKPFDL